MREQNPFFGLGTKPKTDMEFLLAILPKFTKSGCNAEGTGWPCQILEGIMWALGLSYTQGGIYPYTFIIRKKKVPLGHSQFYLDLYQLNLEEDMMFSHIFFSS
jgi:hypothetical protein